ncbi:hypothetical protein FQN54_001695 [Arachnomyces sp. PD_36]|nr:hypothetical protein FQN54_001695 [Arachnomyces sp. PD_36]
MSFLPLLNRPLLYTSIPLLGLSLSLPLAAHHLSSSSPSKSLIHCQYSSPSPISDHPSSSWSFPSESLRNLRCGHISASTARQISLGSVLGLGLGISLRIFSKALVLAIGVGVIVVQFAASKGYNIIPIHRLQKYVKSVDLQKALSENIAFKSSFGLTMALAAVAQF